MAKPSLSPQRKSFLLFLLIRAFFFGELDSSASPLSQQVEQQASAVWTIVGGSSVDREFSGGAPHSFQIALAAGDLFQAFIQQKGVDVVVVLSGPDGQKLEEFSEPVYENRVRSISFIANSDGNYHLLVRPRLKNVTSGLYQLSVETVRPATELDRTRVRAAQITKDANQALGKTAALSIEEAAKIAAKFEEALQLWESLGDARMAAETHLSLGVVSHRTGRLTKALELYEKALQLFPLTPEGVGSRATTLNNIANAYLSLGETRRALEAVLKSLELKKEPGRSRAISLDNLGAIYTMLGEYQLALDYHLQALTSFRALGRRRDEATALNNLAWLWESIGDRDKSIEYMLQALPLVKEAGDKDAEALFLASTGNFCFMKGDNQQALEYANQALDLSRAINNRRAEGGSLRLLCRVYPALGEFEKGLDACSRVLAMHKGSADSLNKAMTLTALSRIHEHKGEKEKAVESLKGALAIYRAIGDPTGELTTLHTLGQLALDSGDLVSARGQIERAVEIAESLRVKVSSHQLRSTYMAGRQEIYESYVDLLMQMSKEEPGKGYEKTALQFSERARARSLLDLLAESHAHIRQGADRALVEKERSLLERLNAKDAAWKLLRNDERTKKQAESVAGEVNDLTTQLQLVEAQIRSSSPRYAGLMQPQSLTHAELQQLLDEGTVLLEFALGKKQSWLWAVTTTATSTHQLLPRQEIELAARRVYELLTARQPKKDETEAQWGARIAEAGSRLHRESCALSRMLLGPIAAKLSQEWKGKRLLIVASGALEYLPFAALAIPSNDNIYKPLIAEHEIVNLPSASVLSVIRREAAGRAAAPRTVAVLADPVFDTGDPRLVTALRRKAGHQIVAINTRSAADARPSGSGSLGDALLKRAVRNADRESLSRLPFSGDEADAIATLVPAGSILKATDFEASRAKALSGELSKYRIVHFATHGLLNSEHPELSGLVLSLIDETGKAQDGFLRMHEIYNLQLPAEVVVLSACQTGLGKEIKGEGLIGLTRGFMYAGAQRVVASLWQVDDLATAEMMKHFYRGMLKDRLRPAAALQSAQIEMMKEKRWSSPFFWAGFVIQGEWK